MMFESKEEKEDTCMKKCPDCGEEFEGPVDERGTCPNCGSKRVYKLGE